jgi:hypothetical protein
MNDHNARKLEIWKRLTPEQRDYDRFVARQIPYGASMTPETRQYNVERAMELLSEGCSCHIAPPCSWCVNQHIEDIEAEQQ